MEKCKKKIGHTKIETHDTYSKTFHSYDSKQMWSLIFLFTHQYFPCLCVNTGLFRLDHSSRRHWPREWRGGHGRWETQKSWVCVFLTEGRMVLREDDAVCMCDWIIDWWLGLAVSGYGKTLAKASWNDFLPDASQVCQDRCGCVCTTFIALSISSELFVVSFTLLWHSH